MFWSGGFVSSRLYPEASSLASVCCNCLWGIAGDVGGSSGMDRLTDVPGFWRDGTVEKAPPECLKRLYEKSRRTPNRGYTG